MSTVQTRSVAQDRSTKRKPMKTAPKPARLRMTVEKEVEDWIQHKKLSAKFGEAIQLAKRVFRQAQLIKVEFFDFWDGPVGEPRVVLCVKMDAEHKEFERIRESFYAPIRNDKTLAPYLVITREF